MTERELILFKRDAMRPGVFAFDDDFYYKDNKPYTRVTRNLDVLNREGLNRWVGSVGNAEAELRRDEAGAIGSEVHKYIKRINEDGFNFNTSKQTAFEWAQLSLEIRNCLKAYVQSEKSNDWEHVISELTMFSERYGYAGTADRIVKYNDALWVMDFKTSKEFWPEVDFQLAAYFTAFQQEFQMPLAGAIAIRLDKGTGQWTPKDIRVLTPDKLDESFKGYLGLKDARDYLIKYWNHGRERCN